MPEAPHILEFHDNHLLAQLVGSQDRHLHLIEKRLGVVLSLRGNKIAISGPEPEATYAQRALQHAYALLVRDQIVEDAEINSA